MNLVKFGTLYINFDRVAAIRDLVPGTGSGPQLVRVEFDGGHVVDVASQAASLRLWLDQNAQVPGSSSP